MDYQHQILMLRHDGKIKSKTVDLWVQIRSLFDEFVDVMPLTVRQVFYQMVSFYDLLKTENSYRRVQRGIRLMRMPEYGSIIPYEWVADNTRWVRQPTTYSSLRAMLDITKQTYRRSLLDCQRVYMEIWLEKLALAGVFYPICSEYDVPLYIASGQSSDTFCFESAQQLKVNRGKPAHVYYFSDFDKYGKSASTAVQRKLKKHGAEFTFQDVALTEQQIIDWNIPTRPPKKGDDRKFAAELDAIPPRTMQQLLRDTIEQHIDPYSLHRIQQAEQAERESVEKIIANATFWD